MTTAHTLTTESLTLGYRDRTVITELTLALPPGRITSIVGANACGKSTLLRALSRLLPPQSGRVLLDGRSVHETPTKALAHTLGLLPQAPSAPEGITVADLVARGRSPHQKPFSRWSAADEHAVHEALTATGTYDLADRPVDELSGGQKQRVWIALALAQQTDVLLLDEPTTFLDIAHQVEVLDLLTDLNRSRGTTIVMVLHDINLAARYSDHLLALAHGTVCAAGTPTEVLSTDMIRQVFGLESHIIRDPLSGHPLMLPIGRHHIAAPAAPAPTPVLAAPAQTHTLPTLESATR